MAEHSQEGADGAVLVVEEDGPVRIVVLNRPASYNAADESLHQALSDVWAELDADPTVGAIVLTGAGRAFSGGGDLDLLDRMVTDVALRQAVMDEAVTIVRSMTAVRVPIVAAVNGPAVGLGCSLSSMCDVVLIEEQAYFADPHVALGLVAADGGALTWPLLTSLFTPRSTSSPETGSPPPRLCRWAWPTGSCPRVRPVPKPSPSPTGWPLFRRSPCGRPRRC